MLNDTFVAAMWLGIVPITIDPLGLFDTIRNYHIVKHITKMLKYYR